MLAEFRVTNYKSFKDEQVLSLIASTEESKGPNSIKIGNHSILKTAVVYGANASGKSNLIKAMACMRDIIDNSAGYKPSDKLPVVPFLFDEETKDQPTTFEATFFIDSIRYQYGFSATRDKIHNEWLLTWPKGKPQTWFKRDINESEPYFGPSLKGKSKSIWYKVKDNSLFLSVAAQWNHKQLSKVYEWFNKKLRELPEQSEASLFTDYLLVKATDSDGFHELALKMLKQADFGIDDFEIEHIIVDEPVFPEDKLDEEMLEFSEKPLIRKKMFHCGRKYSLNLEEESDGTQKCYSLLAPLLLSVRFGHTVFKDELELNLHPLLTREIVGSFRGNEDGGCSAQLIFTTHDTTLLDPELFGRDQVWFTEKDKQGATQLYSLADYKETVRKDEAMQKRYLSGRYGAVPVLERFDLVGTKK